MVCEPIYTVAVPLGFDPIGSYVVHRCRAAYPPTSPDGRSAPTFNRRGITWQR